MHAIGSSPYFWLFLIGVLILTAVLPTLIAMIRGVEDIMLIVLFNVLGCAIVFGWPVALVMAIKWPRPQDLRMPAHRRPQPPSGESDPHMTTSEPI
ncbi:superinfection immunity protein [Actinomadura xylanilytica]|uniref:superinfection immunity protein n=1 Tax=Actinomadura xylanilytica TaxID=887459 RepID=UPI00255AE79B|nr:superinfection immunity protein [Actinomadura xylanilytica]MDL4774268.1 hypothetical protein [Actinomadura xylanilytica]